MTLTGLPGLALLGGDRARKGAGGDASPQLARVTDRE